MTPPEWIAELEARWPGVRVIDLEAREGVDGADLLLAAACLANDPRALGYLDALVINEVRRAVSPLDTTNVLVDEVTQLVRERLLLPPPRLAEYSGQGSLGSWIRAVAVRVALNAKRPGAREEPVSSVPDSPIADADPELALLRSRYREAFRTAFTEAVGALTPRERTMMRLTSLDGLTCAQVGQMYGKDASTISRWLAASRAVLLEKTRLLLSTQLALSPSALDSLMRLADSELDLRISRLLESKTD
jgi:RNA polymerase sigma-70 factor (ECF subfamily)